MGTEDGWECLCVDGIGINQNKLVSACHSGRPCNLYFVICRERKNVFREVLVICTPESSLKLHLL